jgi:hypothetical protein
VSQTNANLEVFTLPVDFCRPLFEVLKLLFCYLGLVLDTVIVHTPDIGAILLEQGKIALAAQGASAKASHLTRIGVP